MTASVLKRMLTDGGDGLLWIEFEAYARRVFANAGDDWYQDAARYAATLIQAQGIIPTRALSVDVTTPCVAALGDAARDADSVVAALSAADRRQFNDAVLDALLHRFGGRLDIVLKLASPSDLLSADGTDNAIDFDALDEVGTALTAMLRHVAAKPIAGVLLEKSASAGFSVDESDACEPVIGAARHYGWVTAVAFPGVTDGAATVGALDVDLILFPDTPLAALRSASAGPACGGGLDATFWNGETLAGATGRILYGTIPVAAQPEAVLSVLRAMAQ